MKKIITLGKEGSYSDIATKKILENSNLSDYEIVYVKTKEEIISSINKKGVYAVVFPIQNKLIGDVSMHYLDDVILEILESKRDLQIRGSINLPINFSLCGSSESNDLQVHKVSAKQCSKFILKKNYNVIFADSNPDAVLNCVKNSCLAIGDGEYIENLGLEILETDIQNEKNNKTRFIYFGEPIISKELTKKNYVYFIPMKNKPNQLFNLLKQISKKKINIEELIVRRRDCSNPRIKTGNVFLIVDSTLDFLQGFEYKIIGNFNLNWE